MTASEAFNKLYDIVAKLRSPEGCPWDREQTPSSLRGALIEETYECLEAIDEDNASHIEEELGDLFLLATMLSFMHEQEGKFSVADVLSKISEKLVRRHPHVFGEVKVKDSAEVLDNWAAIKVEQEGRKPKDSMLDEVSGGLPPMDRAYKLQKKAAKAGFDWQDTEGVIGKIKEELEEVCAALKIAPMNNTVKNTDAKDTAANNTSTMNIAEVEKELGDLLFSVINLCRFLKIEPSIALNRTNSKFIDRFKYIEKKMKETGQEMKKENLNIMDAFWNEAKK
jgi:tetrapyrrole methylase family protein/MazG family protein